LERPALFLGTIEVGESLEKAGEFGVVGVANGDSEEQMFVTDEAAVAEIASLLRNAFLTRSSDEA